MTLQQRHNIKQEWFNGVETISAGTVDNVWYNMAGIKLNGKPTAPGIYINGGRKVVVR